MFLADYHTHSNCSPDGTVPMIQMAEGALAAGVSALCLTDHCDFLSLQGNQRTTHYDWAPVLAQREEMLAQVGTKLELPLGIEFGMSFLDPQAAETVLSQPGLDFVLGAVHNHSEDAGGVDFYFTTFETEEDCYRALDNYFDSMEILAASPYYDVLAHIIYPLRYMTGRYAQPISMRRYTDQIQHILQKAAESGRGMEINTWKGQTLREWLPILQLFRQVHGEIITVGSDAHAPGPVGQGVREAYALLQEQGFRYVAVYRERTPHFIKL